jgi:hypothetical protein
MTYFYVAEEYLVADWSNDFTPKIETLACMIQQMQNTEYLYSANRLSGMREWSTK